MNNNQSQAIGLLIRTSVRPVVTVALTSAAIAATFVFNTPEFLYGLAATAVGFWFSDRSKESEAQRLAFGAAQDTTNIHVTDANIRLMEAQAKLTPPSTPGKNNPNSPAMADARRLGYNLGG